MRMASLLRDALGVEGTVITGIVERSEDRLVLGVRPRSRHMRRCSVCGRRSPWYDRGSGRRRWRALDLGVMRVELEAESRRVKCRRHGVVVAAVPWARPGSRFTRQFEDTVAWLATKTSQYAVKELCRFAWRTVGAIITRVVDEGDGGRKTMGDLRRIGIDETSYRKGHRYITLIVDHDRNRLVWAAPGRSSKVLREFFDLLGPEASARIEVVSRDAAAWIAMVLDERRPQAVQCMDPFHVVQWATKAVDEFRRETFRAPAYWSRTRKARLVQGTRWILLRNRDDLSAEQSEGLAKIEKDNGPLYRAYLLKEQLRLVFQLALPEATRHLDGWLIWARRCQIKQFVDLAKTISEHRDDILASIEHGESNGRVHQHMKRLHRGEFEGPAGRFVKVTRLTNQQKRYLAALQVPEPRLFEKIEVAAQRSQSTSS